MLRKGAALAAGAAAASVAAQTGVASADTGDPVVLGQENEAGGETCIDRTGTTLCASFGYQAAADGSWGIQGVNNSPATGYPASGYPCDAGVFGDTSNAAVAGVLGRNQSTGPAVKGTSSTGIGVQAISTSGTALHVTGRAAFTQAGKSVLRRNSYYANVTGPKVRTGSAILVTLNGSANVTVRYARRTSATSFRVYFSGRVRANTTFSWFVVN